MACIVLGQGGNPFLDRFTRGVCFTQSKLLRFLRESVAQFGREAHL
jgi:hypothetical protein